MEHERENIHDCRVYTLTPKQLKLSYSDGFDFSELILIEGLNEIMNAKIYLRDKKIELHSVRDLSLYYAFGIAMHASDERGKSFIKDYKQDGRPFMILGDWDKNTQTIKDFGEAEHEYIEKYRKNWYEAIIANGFDEEFAKKWVYEQAYCE